MCLILFKYEPDAEHNLIIAANRDEFHSRPTLPAHSGITKALFSQVKTCLEGELG